MKGERFDARPYLSSVSLSGLDIGTVEGFISPFLLLLLLFISLIFVLFSHEKHCQSFIITLKI